MRHGIVKENQRCKILNIAKDTHLAGRTIDSLLRGSNSMDGGHETFNNTKLFINDLCKRSKAVGRAASIGDDLLAGIIRVEVDTDNIHWRISRRGRDDDLFRATFEMSRRLVDGGKYTGRFNNVLSTGCAPGDFRGVLAVSAGLMSVSRIDEKDYKNQARTRRRRRPCGRQ